MWLRPFDRPELVSGPMNELKPLNAILGAIEQSQTVAGLKEVVNELGPLQEYARLAGASLEQINDIGEGRVMAMCKGGFILRGLDRAQGMRSDLTSSKAETKLTPYVGATSR